MIICAPLTGADILITQENTNNLGHFLPVSVRKGDQHTLKLHPWPSPLRGGAPVRVRAARSISTNLCSQATTLHTMLELSTQCERDQRPPMGDGGWGINPPKYLPNLLIAFSWTKSDWKLLWLLPGCKWSIPDCWGSGFLLKCLSNVHPSEVQTLLSEGGCGNPSQHRLLWSVVGPALALTPQGFTSGTAVTGSWRQRKFPPGRLRRVNNFKVPSKSSQWPFAPYPVSADK